VETPERDGSHYQYKSNQAIKALFTAKHSPVREGGRGGGREAIEVWT
jgi:hypothetical protein